MKNASRTRRGPALSVPVRVLAAVYGVLALGFGLVVGGAQLSFAIHGCVTCWIALPLMAAVAVVGGLSLRAAVRRAPRDTARPVAGETIAAASHDGRER